MRSSKGTEEQRS